MAVSWLLQPIEVKHAESANLKTTKHVNVLNVPCIQSGPIWVAVTRYTMDIHTMERQAYCVIYMYLPPNTPLVMEHITPARFL